MESREETRAERRGGILSRLRPGQGGEPETQRESVEALLRTIKRYNPKADLGVIRRAAQFAEVAHVGQKRLSGEDFVEHPTAVAQVLADLGLDTTTLVAALLHDVAEDTEVSLDDLKEGFGAEVTGIVDGLT